jgi:hypothetical protein
MSFRVSRSRESGEQYMHETTKGLVESRLTEPGAGAYTVDAI